MCETDKLGGDPSQIYGVEIDPTVFEVVAERLNQIPRGNLLNADFFDITGENGMLALAPSDLPLVDAIVGNPLKH
ncbi:MAG: hypothetical protein ACTSYL_07685 [Candidatus Thorarchaeota archaeon]